MTQEDKDRTIGQARREYREARGELAVLKLRARQIGEHFAKLCATLINEPEALASPGKEQLFSEAYFQAFAPQPIRELVLEIRNAQARVDTLKKLFIDMGDED